MSSFNPPDPRQVHPIAGQDRVVLLKPLIKSPLIQVGNYSYYDPEHATDFETRNVTHLWARPPHRWEVLCLRSRSHVRHERREPSHERRLPTTSGSAAMPRMFGVRIGHGAIISTTAVVTTDVPDYAIVGGNPAALIRMRYGEDDVRALVTLAWWDWSIDAITAHLRTIMDGSVEYLRAAAATIAQ